MSGRHLRRSRGAALGGMLGALVLGAAVGAAGVTAIDRSARPALASADTVPVRAGDGPVGSAALDPARGPITLAFVGDVHVENVLAERLAADPRTFVGPFAGALHDADLVVANLEAALVPDEDADSLEAADKDYVFRAPAGILDALAAGGVDVVSAANNHAVDFGQLGLARSLDVLAERGDRMVIGIGADEAAAYAPHVRDIGGYEVAVLAATQVLDADLIASWTARTDQPGVASAKRVDRLVEAVDGARRQADVVVVYLHWGVETEECPSTGQQELAAALVDAGADVIVGTHAHRVQGGGRIGSASGRSAVVHYGLGNFLFGAVSEGSARTGVFLVEVDGDGAVGYEWVPGRIAGHVPQPLAGAAAAEEVAAWEAQRSCTDLAP